MFTPDSQLVQLELRRNKMSKQTNPHNVSITLTMHFRYSLICYECRSNKPSVYFYNLRQDKAPTYFMLNFIYLPNIRFQKYQQHSYQQHRLHT